MKWTNDISTSCCHNSSVDSSPDCNLTTRFLDLLAKSLKGYDEETINHIICFMPSRKQKMYTPITAPLSKKEVEQAQLSIVQLAKELGKSGELNLDDILADNEMIE